jgi:ribonuclease VapC
LAGRRVARGSRALADLDAFLADMNIEIVPVTVEQARLAVRARLKFGKGFGTRSGLNYGDCFSYALAKSLSAPLLFIGNDFSKTDIERANF